MPSEARVRDLISKWTAYGGGDYCKLKGLLYQVRNPGFNGAPPISVWPPALIDPDDATMACVEHYFLNRCWVGTGQFPAWQMRLMTGIYDTGKSLGVTPQHNPNKPVTPNSPEQKMFQDEGIRDGEIDLSKSGKSAPWVSSPPKYY